MIMFSTDSWSSFLSGDDSLRADKRFMSDCTGLSLLLASDLLSELLLTDDDDCWPNNDGIWNDDDPLEEPRWLVARLLRVSLVPVDELCARDPSLKSVLLIPEIKSLLKSNPSS